MSDRVRRLAIPAVLAVTVIGGGAALVASCAAHPVPADAEVAIDRSDAAVDAATDSDVDATPVDVAVDVDAPVDTPIV